MPTRKRAADESEPNIEFDDDEDDDDDGDSGEESGEMKDDEEDEEDEEMEDTENGVEKAKQQQQQGSTSKSPSTKEMRLRSGLKKRRRSKETSGLTPPEDAKAKKKIRIAATHKANRQAASTETTTTTTNGDAPDADKQSPTKRPRSSLATTRLKRISTTTKGRSSILATDHVAVALAQDPEQTFTDNTLVLPVAAKKDSNRRLFDRKPPASQEANIEQAPPAPSAPTHSDPQVPTRPAMTTQMNGGHGHDEEEVEMKSPSDRTNSLFLWRLVFMVVLSFAFVAIWPICVSVADWIIPLRELALPDPPAAIAPEPIEEVITTLEEGEELEAPISVMQSLDSITRLHNRASEKKESVGRAHDRLSTSIDELLGRFNEKKGALERSIQLNEAERVLRAALEQDDLGASLWKDARDAVEPLGRVVLDALAIEMWQVETPEECSDIVGQATTLETIASEHDTNPHIDQAVLDGEVDALLEQTMEFAAKAMHSPEASDNVRQWIQMQIQKALRGNPDASSAIADLAAASRKMPSVSVDDENEVVEGLSAEEIASIVEDRLEIERADQTAEYDHASVYNGAKVIRGGKRGTSKSLVDSLPLLNRLLQTSQLRFYGYGPEAAITPTYPADALGQCWSFQQTPLKELLDRRRALNDKNDDDHKRGNFGTLTITLPTPVAVESVVIEHPSQGLTDHPNSAIRAFRIIGYEDAEAMGKSWSLGSFEYSINDPKPLQTFEVATDIFDNPVPPLHSITLAIDSNWGHEYACLYRFRVHGDEEEPYEDDNPFAR